jgi:hypothetical protein
LAWPTHQAGDIGLLCVETASTDSDVSVSGWTHVTGSPVAGTGTKLNVLWKRATSAAEADVSVNDTGDHQYAAIATVRGVSSTLDPPYLDVGTLTSDATSYPTLPGVTMPHSHCLMVSIIARETDATTAQFSSWDLGGPISGGTEVLDSGTTLGSGGGLGIAWVNVFDPGDTFAGSVQSSVSANFAAVALAFGIEPTDCAWLVDHSTSASTINTAFDVTYPSTIEAGDLALLFIEQSGNDSAVTATGFAHVSGSPIYELNTTAGSLFSVMYRVLDGTETTTTISAPADHAVARLYVFRNAEIDTVSSQTKTTASTTGTHPSVTTATDNELIVLPISRPNDATTYHFSAWTNANLSDLTEPYYETGTANGNGGGFGVGFGYKDTAGSTGTTTVTIAASLTDVAYTIALKAQSKGGLFWANNC